MTPLKKLYEFTLERDQEVEIIEERLENGETIEVKKKATQPVSIPLFIKMPNRVEKEDIELQYDVEFSKLVKAGVLTKAMLDKQYAEQGGMWTDDEDKVRTKVRKEFVAKYTEYQENKDKLTPEETETLGEEIMKLEEFLTNFKTVEESLYNNCADNKARNKVINYLVANFCYIEEEKDKPRLFFSGESIEDRLDDYSDKEESDDKFVREATQFFAFFITLWYVGGINSKSEFAAREKLYRRALDATNEGTEGTE